MSFLKPVPEIASFVWIFKKLKNLNLLNNQNTSDFTDPTCLFNLKSELFNSSVSYRTSTILIECDD